MCEAQFRVGTQFGRSGNGHASGEDYSRLAETAISTMYDAASDIERQYGRIVAASGGGRFGQVGQWGDDLQSDLDLILFAIARFRGVSDGAEPLDADRWFARAARRLMNGLSAPTSGDLFEVDTRRPQAMPPAGHQVQQFCPLSSPSHGIGSIWR